MEKKEPIYITGHMHPDTDSIASAIAMTFFMRAKGERAVACRLGPVNPETAWLLKRFGFEEPKLLKDARKKISEIEIDEPVFATPEMTVSDVLKEMNDHDRGSLAVCQDDGKLVGYISKSDLANLGLGDTAAEIDLLQKTDVYHLAEAIDGTVIYDDPQVHVNGKVSIIALSTTKTKNYDITDRIVIVGDDPESQKKLIEKGAGVLIAVWCQNFREDVLEAAKKHHCPVIRSGHGSMNTTRYLFLAPPIRLIMKTPKVFREDEFVEDAARKMMKTRYRSYPVVDLEGRLRGYIARFHVLNYTNKKLILVDHNEFSQSVHAVEKAQILQVIDHHRINDFATSQPVSFRNEIVGSTATIVTTMYRENQIPMSPQMAGLLLGAVLSDTLLFQSPTTTRKDHEVANVLAAVADLDIEEFGKEMFAASADNGKGSIHDAIVQDIKYYEIGGCKTMISQCIVSSIQNIHDREQEIQAELERLAEKKNLDLIVAAFSSIVDYGSVFYAAGERSDKVREAFPDPEGEPHSLQTGILSRKLQILPKLTSALNE
jgi:manganese-dependent inorganic pyrophosphatase